MVDVKQGELTQQQVNGMLYKPRQINSQDQIIQLGINCYSSLKVAFIEELEIQPSKDYHDSHSNHIYIYIYISIVLVWLGVVTYGKR